MGYTFCRNWRVIDDVLRHLRRTDRFSVGVRMTHTTVIGRCHWYVVALPNGSKFIGLDLLEKDGGEWGYKDMDETAGPCELSCPVEYIREVQDTPPIGFAADWRTRVLAYHGIQTQPQTQPTEGANQPTEGANQPTEGATV